MKISMPTNYLDNRFGFEKTLEIIKSAGFDCADVTMSFLYKPDHYFNGDDWQDKAVRAKKKADQLGLTFNQAHAPFPSTFENGEDYNEERKRYLMRSFYICRLLGIPKIVVHPIFDIRMTESQIVRLNLEMYNSLEPVAKETGVRICIENIWRMDRITKKIIPLVSFLDEDLIKGIEALDKDVFCFCVDVGHTLLVGENIYETITGAGKHVKALHVHDNLGTSDSHFIPFEGKIDWEGFIKALTEIDYDGEITFECNSAFFRNVPEDFIVDSAKYLCKVGRYLASRIEDCKVDIKQ